jgi:hypothetical protein
MVPPAPASGFHPAAFSSRLAAPVSEETCSFAIEALIIVNAFHLLWPTLWLVFKGKSATILSTYA